MNADVSVFDVNNRAYEAQEGTSQAREQTLEAEMMYDHLSHDQEIDEVIPRLRDDDDL